ncbi:MAG: RHS repeat-associated core domain-containing protein [Fibrobacter sp.]|uniref:RHS repeat domain-containing protein n=1 Tax=Fibrobacter sp. TaxID=35828 RepID=UPI0025BC1DDD|nr:RHS repeat-associated core domain-containing protein [Fibrobacter sp.]MBQ7078995.1 RHS repeat-associated core domain-containing protein [Fibrobacter sp.]
MKILQHQQKPFADSKDDISESADNRNMSDPDNFVYDSEGNLTEDKSKRLKISYDWRGMPIEFKQTAMPQGSTDNELYKLEMKYDGSGRRISKTVWRKAVGAENWQKKQVTHYTGIGTEIRENYHNESLEKAKVVVNMPEGLGRYGIEDAKSPDMGFGAGYIPNVKFEWYLKNHLGSTMLVYGTEGNATSNPFTLGTPLAAYDYRAFGEMLELLPPPTGKVTENFTGKEHDDEIALNYFGARYLDPMLGMWISVDPKRQFDSPYLYAGNGMNPVNVVDPNGNYAIWEHNADDPANHHYVYRYSSYADFAIEGFASFFILGSGLLACMPPKGLVEHSLRPSPAEGVFSTVFSAAGFAVNNLIKVASGVKLAFKTVGTVKNIYDAGQFALKGPRLENFMHDLTSGSNLLSSTNLEDLKRKAEWATSYGKNLLDKGVEINDDVRAQFQSDFQSEFANDTKD